MRLRRLLILSVLMQAAAVAAHTEQPLPLRVVGNRVRDARGRDVRLRGVNLPSLEWSNTGDAPLLASVAEAVGTWHATVIRLPVNQDRWFGKAPGQTDGGHTYRAIVDGVLHAIAARGAYAILDLHWSDGGQWGQNIGQHALPDDNSLVFWKSAAARYANRPAILFDLYNEPQDMAWEVWKNGGTIHEDFNKQPLAYHGVGMQTVLNTIRATGANNVVLAGGTNWGYDLTGVAHGYALTDAQGRGVVYSTHIYPWKTDWENKVAVTGRTHPIFVGEVGCEPDPKQEDPATWAPKIFAFMDKHGYGWTAWCWHTSATPRLLLDWNFTPTPYWGAPVKAALQGEG